MDLSLLFSPEMTVIVKSREKVSSEWWRPSERFGLTSSIHAVPFVSCIEFTGNRGDQFCLYFLSIGAAPTSPAFSKAKR